MNLRRRNSFILLCFVAISWADSRHHNDSGPLVDQSEGCPFWFSYDHTRRQCACQIDTSLKEILQCNEEEVWLRTGYCMTTVNERGTAKWYIAPCYYFRGNLDAYKVTQGGNFIILPRNGSELNDYMCGPLKRTGRLCSECLDGFGPSITSLGAQCSNCTQVWYGTLLYLLVEFVPLTVFYLIVLLFGISLTSAPMVAFVFFSQIGVAFYLYFGNKFIVESEPANYVILVFATFYGFWNLDFFRYVIPPFCISPKLKLVHITFSYYISAFYPLFLICATWFIIELHSHSFKPVVWLWEIMSMCMKRLKFKASYNYSLIDVFATFFLLSYAKIVFVTLKILSPTRAFVIHNYTVHTSRLAEDPSIDYFDKTHLPFALASIAVFLFSISPLTLLLSFYPVRAFRTLLFKCLNTRLIASVNIFVEKYYTCYRDGTEGGRDLRSLVTLYFLLRMFVSFLYTEPLFAFKDSTTYTAILYGGCSLLIALVRPYKQSHMTVLDALILGNLSLLTMLVSLKYYNIAKSKSDHLTLHISNIFLSLPLLGLVGVVTYKILSKHCNNKVIQTVCCCLGKKGAWVSGDRVQLNNSTRFSSSEIKISTDCDDLLELSESRYTDMEELEEPGVN